MSENIQLDSYQEKETYENNEDCVESFDVLNKRIDYNVRLIKFYYRI